MQTSFKIGIVLLAATLGLAGCGLRGPLLMPKEDALPGLAAALQVETTASNDPNAPKPAPDAPPPKPHKAFILDDLLR